MNTESGNDAQLLRIIVNALIIEWWAVQDLNL